jgi:hypothetical protein
MVERAFVIAAHSPYKSGGVMRHGVRGVEPQRLAIGCFGFVQIILLAGVVP